MKWLARRHRSTSQDYLKVVCKASDTTITTILISIYQLTLKLVVIFQIVVWLKQSTPGSVVPLAMFWPLYPDLFQICSKLFHHVLEALVIKIAKWGPLAPHDGHS